MSVAILALALSLSMASSTSLDSCSDTLTNLETALYSNGQNILNMERAFFPTLEQTSRYLRVVYNFTDGDDDDCTVTFFWSVGSFLFIQPPSIFTYTSLLFNFPSNTVDNLTITLPNECRPLVNNSKVCSCKFEGITYLDMLTRHLQDYSRVNSPGSVSRDDKTTVRIACGEELKNVYYRGFRVYLFFSMTLVVPFGLLVMAALFVRLHRKQIEMKCLNPSSHGNIAGVILTSVFVMMYIIGLDIIALINIFNNSHEYREYDVRNSFNFYVVVITAFLDLFAMLYSITVWLMFVSWTCTYRQDKCRCCHQSKITSCLSNILKCLFAPYLYLVFGYKKHDKFWKEYQEEDKDVKDKVFAIRQIWALLSLMIGPLFGVFTHICYILVAWLTEPQKTSSIFIFAFIYSVFVFAIFRAVYRSESNSIHSARNNGTIGVTILNFFQSFCQCCIVCCANYGSNCVTNMEPLSIDIGEECRNELNLKPKEESPIPMTSLKPSGIEKHKSELNLLPKQEVSVYQINDLDSAIIFSKARLLSTFIIGVIATIPLALIILGFTYIPVPSLELADYLRNVIEIGLVLFAAFATHKIFSFKEPDLNLLIKKFKEKYQTNTPLSDNLFEACGEIAGEVCHTIQSRQGYPIVHNKQNLATSDATPTAEAELVIETTI